MNLDTHRWHISAEQNCCYKCEKRNPDCHSYCEEYIAWKKQLDEENIKEKLKKTGYDFSAWRRGSYLGRRKK